MLLRVSGEHDGLTTNLKAVTAEDGSDGGIPQGAALIAFASAVLGDDDAALDRARAILVDRLGEAAAVDAAAVVATFSTMDRIADGTGIPVDENGAELRRAIGDELGLAHLDREAAAPSS